MAACATPRPTPAEIAAADVGAPPSHESVIQWVDRYFNEVLDDPAAKNVRYGEPRKAFYVHSRPPYNERIAWMVPIEIRVPDSSEPKPYDFYFDHNAPLAVGFVQALENGQPYYFVCELARGGAPMLGPDQVLSDPAGTRRDLQFE